MISEQLTHARARDTLPMSVANMTFLVNKLGAECGPLQFLRELTQNAIEGIQRLDGAGGEIVWDANWPHFDLDNVFKLCCIDTGSGMSGPEMVQYINQLSSSVRQQSDSGNFGVGAKIAAAPRNPHGLLYLSWKQGVGHMIHLRLDVDEGVYGLKRWPQNGGEFWTPVSADLKPSQIGDHGTVVVLLGESDEHNTMEAPPGTPMKSRWILRYLNTRYFRFPTGVVVKAREGWEIPRTNTKHNFLREIDGQAEWLEKNSHARGELELASATARWWIVKSDVDRDSGHFAPGGHIAALYQNELYEMMHGRAGIARLQAFGVIFGTDRVVIYVELKPTDELPVSANTARTQLLMRGEPLDWSAWAAEFREKLPDALRLLQEEIGSKAGEKDYRKAISERLKQIRDLLRFSRFKPALEGGHPIDPSAGTAGGEATRSDLQPHDGVQQSGKKGGRAGDIYALFAEGGPTFGDPVETMQEPEPKWVSVEDGTRTPPDLDDRAAKFLLQQNLLLINADFRVFTDMTDRWVRAYAQVPGSAKTVREVVQEWFAQQLIEAVMSAQALRRTGRWSFSELERLWQEDALTAVVLPRWHIDQSIKRNLGVRLGSLKAAPIVEAAE